MDLTPSAGLFFAAGLGTRMRPLTLDRPKPLVTVGGTTLLDHALALGSGLTRRVVNTHYLAPLIVTHLAGTGVLISDETDLLRDTGGGLRHAMPLLGPGPVFTLNTDAIWSGPNPFDLLAGHWRPGEMEALMLCIPRDRALGHAGPGDVLREADGRLHFGAGAVYSGAQIIDPAALAGHDDPVFSLRAVWERLAGRGTLHGLDYPGRWCDVGHPDAIPLAETLL
ncbi:nucleotidyltransferase family protein [Histidinibacterium lentulum]|uniref:Nucleotidyltransferase family protein n=1 Tax=Histidinibacterium lentulum TaxID=2480588 RepID=A0A3N2R6R7_9RHOB|nr:nucleotidyltransferase family protein [Histidinibacterium lentulum]ROU03180.1 nucleotidyltransferase family protein [Histidinibacterium lentulum]